MAVKKMRLGKQLVYRPQAKGGLGLPNLWLYYLSASLVQLAQWHAPQARIPWICFEGFSKALYYLPGPLWMSTARPKDLALLNELVSQSLHLWSLYKAKYSLMPSVGSFFG